MAMELDAHLLYFTKLSGKSLDFYFLVGTTLSQHPCWNAEIILLVPGCADDKIWYAFEVLKICQFWQRMPEMLILPASVHIHDAGSDTCTVYPKKYAHGFCFAVLCCGYTLTDFPISIRLTSLALWQSNDCPSASKATLMNMDKYFMWIHYERLHNHNKAKHNKTVCIFLGIYCISITLKYNSSMIEPLGNINKLFVSFSARFGLPSPLTVQANFHLHNCMN